MSLQDAGQMAFDASYGVDVTRQFNHLRRTNRGIDLRREATVVTSRCLRRHKELGLWVAGELAEAGFETTGQATRHVEPRHPCYRIERTFGGVRRMPRE